MNRDQMTVLLVEDQATDVLLVKRAFSRANSSTVVQTVSDGDAAVAYLLGEGEFGDRARFPFPHLLLLDLKLPRRSGLEVLEWVRKHGHFHRLPTIMLTSSSEMSDVNQAYDLGVNSYLSKPTAFEDLIRLVQTIDDYWVKWNQRPEIEAAG
jgi:CheY-like chemotaxis protein